MLYVLRVFLRIPYLFSYSNLSENFFVNSKHKLFKQASVTAQLILRRCIINVTLYRNP